MHVEDFSGTLTGVDAFVEIVLPYIAATDNSAFKPKANRHNPGSKTCSATLKSNAVCDQGFSFLQNDSASCYDGSLRQLRPMRRLDRLTLVANTKLAQPVLSLYQPVPKEQRRLVV